MLIPEYIQMKNMIDLLDSAKEEDMSKWSAQLEEDIILFHTEVFHISFLSDVWHVEP
jgi:hypothetical protein